MAQVQEFYRKDIDGLRAIAILSVVAYHAGLPGVQGGFVGVDVFFVLSGYLITSLLLAEARKDGTISSRSFYARRIRRLFPALFVVVCVTSILGFFILLPVFDEQQDLARSGIATALYVSNFYFWLRSPGYFDQSSDLKPLLHTWSLSVEEQFYMIWPLIVLTTVGVARRQQWDLGRALLVATVTILVASLAWSIAQTQTNQTAAFYLLPSRAWELATGATLALWLPGVVRRSALAGGACSLIGVSAVILAVVVFTPDMRFPGYLAVLPVIGTALVVIGGHLATDNPVQRVLTMRPMVFIGLLSYSWYLWHWPLLALSRAHALQEVNLVRDLSIVALSLLFAYLSYRLVENPIRFGRPGPFNRTETTLAAGVVISLVMCVPAGVLGAWAKFVGSKQPEFQPLFAARNDRPSLRSKCHQSPPFVRLAYAENCITGEGGRPPSLVLWGDSHADHLSPLMQEFTAQTANTRVLVRSFTGCPPLAKFETGDSRQDEACRLFNEAVASEITELSQVGLRGVVLSGRWLDVFGAPRLQAISGQPAGEHLSLSSPTNVDHLTAMIDRLTALGLRVIIVAPMPEPRFDVPRCLARRTLGECSVERRLADAQRGDVVRSLSQLKSRWPGVQVLDLVDSLCNEDKCPAVKGGRILFLDDDHLTASASRSLLPAATEALKWASGST